MKRLRIIGSVFAILLVAVLVFWLVRPGEPSHQGRKLSGWLVDFSAQVNDITDPRNAALRCESAKRAIKEIGAKAIPSLLKWLQATPSPLKERLNLLLAKQNLIRFRFEKFEWTQSKALSGFQILGPDAAPAIPALMRLMQSSDANLQHRALDSLFFIDHEEKAALPELLQLLHDPNPITQTRVAAYLKSRYPEQSAKVGAAK